LAQGRAGYKPAIQQIANLRYDAAVASSSIPRIPQ